MNSKLKYIFSSVALGVGGGVLGTYGVGPMDFKASYAPYLMAGAGAALSPAWWLLANIPPPPVRVPFPAITLLDDMITEEQKPVTMPHWKKMICLLPFMAAAMAASNPKISHDYIASSGNQPVVITVDNGWGAAKNWSVLKEQIGLLIDEAEEKSRKIVLLSNASPEDSYIAMDATQARVKLAGWTPRAWPVNRDLQIPVLEKFRSEFSSPTSVFWLSNGLNGKGTKFIEEIQKLGQVSVFQPKSKDDPYLLSLLKSTGHEITVSVKRPNGGVQKTISVTASDEVGQPLAQQEVRFEGNEVEKKVTFKVDPRIRKNITRLYINNEKTAGSVLLLDEKWQERSIGLIHTGAVSAFDESRFIQQATEPITDYHQGNVTSLIDKKLSVIILTDDTSLSSLERTKLEKWVESGGTLLRFAGPRLAAQPADSLVPVSLRSGIKYTGTVLSGTNKERMAPFDAKSPFKGISIPPGVDIQQMVLAKPDAELEKHTWARLENGVPLVTANKRGNGSIILFHTSASPSWSNLPIEGAEMFLPMLQTIITYSNSLASGKKLDKTLRPHRILSAQGRLEDPPHTTKPITPDVITSGTMNVSYPPGYYGREYRVAYNISDVTPSRYLDRLDKLPSSMTQRSYASNVKDNDYGAWLWSLAFLGLVGSIAVTGGISSIGRSGQKNNSARKPT